MKTAAIKWGPIVWCRLWATAFAGFLLIFNHCFIGINIVMLPTPITAACTNIGILGNCSHINSS